ncbi:unnamed protein product [Peronospora belbahrii]|uniref:Uncharacterized protein n=1 Tax=Peronospora belbahrii TaxID=622444 RepID=A0AAU9KYJ9_9STRA|nr:unnamed protein product [Peronospora belbahrii]CAH0519419.1 unnamed protein product [Peronospora belbahrii]
MSVKAVDTTTRKQTVVEDTDSPTSTSIHMKIESEQDVEIEDGEYHDSENVEGIANGVLNKNFVAGTQEERSTKKRRRVSFECADIVEFEPTIYTTSVTSGGVPVGMSLNERSRSRRRLDSFEMERKDERVGRQSYMEEGYLDPQEREIILSNAGCENPVIALVEAEVNAIIQHRRESNEVDFDFMYGIGEMEDDEEEVEEDEEVSNMLMYARDGSVDKLQKERVQNDEKSLREDAVTFDEGSNGQDMTLIPLKTTADQCSDDEPEAAAI